MSIGNIGSQQVPVARTEGAGQVGDVRGTGEGIGGHQARVGDAPGRGIGQILKSVASGIGKAFKSIGNFIARVGNGVVGRIQSWAADRATARQIIAETSTRMDRDREMLERGTSMESFRTVCIQCMSDDPSVQDMITTNLDNPDYSSETFTGIVDHPSDPSKFIAKFGDKEMVFSDRAPTNREFRGSILRQRLQESTFGSLRELIEPNHLGPLDSMARYASTPTTNVLMAQTEGLSQGAKHAIRDAVAQMPFVHGKTFGEIADLSFLD